MNAVGYLTNMNRVKVRKLLGPQQSRRSSKKKQERGETFSHYKVSPGDKSKVDRSTRPDRSTKSRKIQVDSSVNKVPTRPIINDPTSRSD